MTGKDKFIEMVDELIKNNKDLELNEDAIAFFKIYKSAATCEAPKFTKDGGKILKYLQEHSEDFGNMFTAKGVGEAMSISSRTASGAIRKLVSDKYVEKIGDKPVIYTLTEKGRTVEIEY